MLNNQRVYTIVIRGHVARRRLVQGVGYSLCRFHEEVIGDAAGFATPQGKSMQPPSPSDQSVVQTWGKHGGSMVKTMENPGKNGEKHGNNHGNPRTCMEQVRWKAILTMKMSKLSDGIYQPKMDFGEKILGLQMMASQINMVYA